MASGSAKSVWRASSSQRRAAAMGSSPRSASVMPSDMSQFSPATGRCAVLRSRWAAAEGPHEKGDDMAVPLFSGYTLAVLWDCDDTLMPGYQQKPIFEAYGVEEREFWADVTASMSAY